MVKRRQWKPQTNTKPVQNIICRVSQKQCKCEYKYKYTSNTNTLQIQIHFKYKMQTNINSNIIYMVSQVQNMYQIPNNKILIHLRMSQIKWLFKIKDKSSTKKNSIDITCIFLFTHLINVFWKSHYSGTPYKSAH